MLRRAIPLALLAGALAGPAGAQSTAPLTLSDALARAQAQSPALAAARARVDAAREATTRIGWLPNPTAELRSENWASGAGGALPLDVFATLTQTVELGGKRGARRAIATAGLDAATAAEAVVARDVARHVVGEYLAALRAREHARERGAFAEQMTEAARVMAQRVEVGAAPEADLLKLRTEDARAVVERGRADLAAARALATLSAVLGTDVSGEALATPPRPALPALDAGVAPTHPEIALAAGAVATARAAVDLEQSRAVPDLGVNAGYKRTGGFNTGVVAVTVPVPLFDRNGVARALAAGQARAAEQDRAATERRLAGAFSAAHRAATILASRATDLDATLVVPARGARDAARAAFAAGALDVLRLVDAERLYVDAAIAAVDVVIDAVEATIEARLAAGEEPLP
ncbi:MAG: TolC family protein [Vicinamibacterales bacterium]